VSLSLSLEALNDVIKEQNGIKQKKSAQELQSGDVGRYIHVDLNEVTLGQPGAHHLPVSGIGGDETCQRHHSCLHLHHTALCEHSSFLP